MKRFEDILGMTQEKLKDYLSNYLCGIGYKISSNDGYVFAKGDIPVLLIAHMDTSRNVIPTTILKLPMSDGTVRITAEDSLVGGDDRCGCWMIMNIIKKAKCSVLFLEDEEIGCVGARKFAKSEHIQYIKENISFMIELDRRGSNDCVFYRNDNRDFVKYIEEKTGTKEAQGSMSDISVLMPETKTAGVNLSCGYYNEHTKDEYIVLSEMEDMMNRVIKFLTSEEEFKAFEYVEKKYEYSKQLSFGDYGWGGWYKKRDRRFPNEVALDDLDDLKLTVLFVPDYSELYGVEEAESTGRNKAECWARLFLENPELSFDMIDTYEFS